MKINPVYYQTYNYNIDKNKKASFNRFNSFYLSTNQHDTVSFTGEDNFNEDKPNNYINLSKEEKEFLEKYIKPIDDIIKYYDKKIDSANNRKAREKFRQEKQLAINIHEQYKELFVTRILEAKPKGFSKIAGMNALKQELREDVIYPLTKAELYKSYGLDIVNGFLLYGPPGCGKTFIVEQLAEETGRYFVEIKASVLGSKYQYETQKNIKSKFDEARKNAPSIVFIDEAESIAPRRSELSEENPDYNGVVTELLEQINNCKGDNILVIIASNEPQKIDNAIKRTGRIDKKIFIGPPDEETRVALFQLFLDNIEKKENNIDINTLAKLTDYYTAEDIRLLLRQASMKAMRAEKLVDTKFILNEIKNVSPSLNQQIVEDYRKKGNIC